MNYKSYKKDVLKALDKAEKQALELIGEQARTGIVDEITAQGIVDTGYLRNSANYVVEGNKQFDVTDEKGTKKDSVNVKRTDYGGDGVIVGATAEYAPYIELGTSKKSARPYLKQGVLRRSREFRKIVDHIYKKVLK